jgi:hypothetical protein
MPPSWRRRTGEGDIYVLDFGLTNNRQAAYWAAYGRALARLRSGGGHHHHRPDTPLRDVSTHRPRCGLPGADREAIVVFSPVSFSAPPALGTEFAQCLNLGHTTVSAHGGGQFVGPPGVRWHQLVGFKREYPAVGGFVGAPQPRQH